MSPGKQLAFPEAVAKAALAEGAFMYVHYRHSSQAWDGRSWLGALENHFGGQLPLARRHEAQAAALGVGPRRASPLSPHAPSYGEV